MCFCDQASVLAVGALPPKMHSQVTPRPRELRNLWLSSQNLLSFQHVLNQCYYFEVALWLARRRHLMLSPNIIQNLPEMSLKIHLDRLRNNNLLLKTKQQKTNLRHHGSSKVFMPRCWHKRGEKPKEREGDEPSFRHPRDARGIVLVLELYKEHRTNLIVQGFQ